MTYADAWQPMLDRAVSLSRGHFSAGRYRVRRVFYSRTRRFVWTCERIGGLP